MSQLHDHTFILNKEKDLLELGAVSLHGQVSRIQFEFELKANFCKRINRLVTKQPDLEVYVNSKKNGLEYLDWKWLDQVQRLVIDDSAFFYNPRHFDQLVKIKHLTLSNLTHCSPAFAFTHMPELEKLEIYHSDVSIYDYQDQPGGLHPEVKLKSLKIVGNAHIDHLFFRKHFGPVHTLEEIHLERLSKLTKLKFLGHLPQLKRLTLSGLKRVKQVKTLRNSNSLIHLELKNMSLKETEGQIEEWFPGVTYHAVSFADHLG